MDSNKLYEVCNDGLKRCTAFEMDLFFVRTHPDPYAVQSWGGGTGERVAIAVRVIYFHRTVNVALARFCRAFFYSFERRLGELPNAV